MGCTELGSACGLLELQKSLSGEVMTCCMQWCEIGLLVQGMHRWHGMDWDMAGCIDSFTTPIPNFWRAQPSLGRRLWEWWAFMWHLIIIQAANHLHWFGERPAERTESLEFQQRGELHAQMHYWVLGCPSIRCELHLQVRLPSRGRVFILMATCESREKDLVLPNYLTTREELSMFIVEGENCKRLQ